MKNGEYKQTLLLYNKNYDVENELYIKLISIKS